MPTEIKITVSSPELTEAINNLANAIAGFKMPTTVSGKELEKAIKSATKEAVEGKDVTSLSEVDMAKQDEPETKKEEKPATSEKVEQSSMDLPPNAEEITLEMLRAMGAKLKSKGIATKQVINDMGYEKLSAVPKAQYAELHTRFVSLLESTNGES